MSKAPKDKKIIYAHVSPTYKNWVEKKSRMIGTSQSVIVQAALKFAKNHKEFAVK